MRAKVVTALGGSVAYSHVWGTIHRIRPTQHNPLTLFDASLGHLAALCLAGNVGLVSQGAKQKLSSLKLRLRVRLTLLHPFRQRRISQIEERQDE